MPKFKIFAGLSGGFGGPEYHGTYEYPNRDEAMKDAYDLVDSGFIDTINDNEIEEMVNDAYQEQVEGWLTYNAIPVKPGEKETDINYTIYTPYYE